MGEARFQAKYLLQRCFAILGTSKFPIEIAQQGMSLSNTKQCGQYNPSQLTEGYK